MKKTLVLILIFIGLTFVGGCQSQQVYSSGTDSIHSIAVQKSSSSNPGSTGTGKNVVMNDVANQSNSFEELHSNMALHEMTYFGHDKVFSEIAGNQTVDYAIRYPEDWKIQYTVFHTGSDQRKVAELFPVVLLKPDEESEFLDIQIPEVYTEIEVVSKERIDFERFQGVRVILKVAAEEPWYSHEYYLTDGTYGFGIALYSYLESINEDEQRLFDEIVSTIQV